MEPKKLISAAFAVAVVAACHASVSAGVGQTSTTGAEQRTDPGAVEQVTAELVQARCARAYSCGDVGPNGRWEDDGACTIAVRRSVRDDLIQRECKEGFDPQAVDGCVRALRDARCDARDVRSIKACESALRCR